MDLRRLGQVIRGVFSKVADFVRPDPEPEPRLAKDSLRVSPAARTAAANQPQIPVLPACGPVPAAPAQATTVADTVYRPGADQTYGDLVYRGENDGVADGNMVLYRPGRESGRVGPMQVADNSTPGRGQNQPSTGVWA